jgi:hypothetical protein
MNKALVIGINDYPSAPLNACIQDATAVFTLLETNGDGSPNFAARLRTDITTKAELKAAVDELFQGICDTALLYFSGHGLLNSSGGFLVTPDYQRHDEGLSMDSILAFINKSQAKNKIIILDCCHSGAMGAPAATAALAGAQLMDGVVILTASRDSESAVEVNGHGVFTSLLLDALRGGAADLRGHITPGSVYAYIDQALGPWEQRPVFKTNVSRFTSLRTVPPQVPIDVLRKITTYFKAPQEHFPLDPTFEDTNEAIAVPENVAIFKHLQKFQSVGLVVPVDADFMFFAAQNSTACRLTALGYHYWRLVSEKLI